MFEVHYLDRVPVLVLVSPSLQFPMSKWQQHRMVEGWPLVQVGLWRETGETEYLACHFSNQDVRKS